MTGQNQVLLQLVSLVLMLGTEQSLARRALYTGCPGIGQVLIEKLTELILVGRDLTCCCAESLKGNLISSVKKDGNLAYLTDWDTLVECSVMNQEDNLGNLDDSSALCLKMFAAGHSQDSVRAYLVLRVDSPTGAGRTFAVRSSAASPEHSAASCQCHPGLGDSRGRIVACQADPTSFLGVRQGL